MDLFELGYAYFTEKDPERVVQCWNKILNYNIRVPIYQRFQVPSYYATWEEFLGAKIWANATADSVNGSVFQDWVVDWAPTDLKRSHEWQYSQHTSADQTPIPYVPVASPGLKPKGRMWRADAPALSNRAALAWGAKPMNAATLGLGNLVRYLPIKHHYALVMPAHPAQGECRCKYKYLVIDTKDGGRCYLVYFFQKKRRRSNS